MEKSSNIHEGHRERLLDKLFHSPKHFNDHELLEALLFYAIPRIDTNPLAHALIREFGSLDKIFSASPSQLTQVPGVGKKTATLIVCLGEIYRRISSTKKEKVVMYTLSDVKKAVVNCFNDVVVEKFLVSLLNKRYEVIKTVEFCDDEHGSVGLDVQKIAEEFTIHKPAFVVLSHNHTSGNVNPSKEDMISTMKIRLICELYGVDLIDHVIVSGQKVFSFYSEGILDQIKKQTNIQNVLDTIKEI